MAKILALVLALSLWSTLAVHGMSIGGPGQRCLCGGRSADRFPAAPSRKLEIFWPSNRCDRVEVVVTLKTGARTCLNYYSKPVRSGIVRFLKQRQK
ncbi:C-X-C motif chemokine 11-like [Ambystoma mexicanum]|uniref:C-X-C motif chemokine 11-like n=1 Tax=Ambystoma mexicanum TaxID=8296 RepID=UPI0037E787E6